MSIAVTAVIEPSRLLRRALAVHALACGSAAGLLLSGRAGVFHHPQWLAAACLLGAMLAWRAAARPLTARRIDISGLGDIHLTVKHCNGVPPAQARAVQLMPGSTVWPSLLLLLLRGEDKGPVTVLMILPGCVAPDEFRRLAVSIRAIARRDNKFFGNNKIL